MTDEQIALGRRVVACKGFRWMGGMKVVDGFRVVESVVPMMFPVDTPDLTDPATLGCLLALVREAWGPDHILETRQFRTFGEVEVYVDEGRCFVHPTLAEALVAALEAAP